MRNAVNPCIYRPVKPPCKKDGADCPKRKVGCRKDCTDWDEYQIALQAEKDKAWNAGAGDFFTGAYQTKAASAAIKKVRR